MKAFASIDFNGKSRLALLLYIVLPSLLITKAVSAAEPAKLSSFQPLTVEDAYPTRFNRVEAETIFRWDHERDNKDLFEPRARVKWGALENLQLSVQVPYRLGTTSDRDSGQVVFDSLYQFTKDRDGLPAMAISPSIAPSLGQQQGTETNLTFLATKSLSGKQEGPNLHLNLSWLHIIDNAATDRENRYRAVVGYSHPFSKDTALVLDFVREQRRERGSNSNFVEIGVRQRVAEDLTFSVGAGAGIGEDSPDARVVVGLQKSFKLD